MTGVAGIIYLHRQEPGRVRGGRLDEGCQIGDSGGRGPGLLPPLLWPCAFPRPLCPPLSTSTDHSHQQQGCLPPKQMKTPAPLLHLFLPSTLPPTAVLTVSFSPQSQTFQKNPLPSFVHLPAPASQQSLMKDHIQNLLEQQPPKELSMIRK